MLVHLFCVPHVSPTSPVFLVFLPVFPELLAFVIPFAFLFVDLPKAVIVSFVACLQQTLVFRVSVRESQLTSFKHAFCCSTCLPVCLHLGISGRSFFFFFVIAGGLDFHWLHVSHGRSYSGPDGGGNASEAVVLAKKKLSEQQHAQFSQFS